MAKKLTTAEDALTRFLPVQINSAVQAAELAEAEQITIFEIDGTAYSMAKAPRADIALEYLALVSEGESDRAAYNLLVATIGIEGYNALKNVEGLSDKQFDGVLERVTKIALPKGRESATTPR